MRYTAVLLLMLPVVGCGESQSPPDSPNPLEQIHAEFRREIEKELPADYSSVDIQGNIKKFQAIAKRVYGPHAAELRQEAARLLAELPALGSDALEGYVERFPHARDVGLAAIVEQDKTGSLAEMLYISKAWDPSAAARLAKNIMLPRLAAPKEMGARAFHETFIADRIYRSDRTESAPSVAIKSLQDIFIVTLSLDECGCYAPLEIKWYARKK